MDSISYFVFVLLLTIVTASKDDISINLTFKKAALEKNSEGLYITDGTAASLVKDSDTLKMEQKNSVFEKNSAERTTTINDGLSTALYKFSDNSVAIYTEKSTLTKYNTEEVDIKHGDSIKLCRDSDAVIIEDGVLSLSKNSEGSTTLCDKSSSITKYSDDYVSIVEKQSSIIKESTGEVKIHDGKTAFIEKDSEGTVEICHAKSYIRKYSDGETSVQDGNTHIVSTADGYIEVRDQRLVIIADDNGDQRLDDGHSSIVKDSPTKLTIKDGPLKIVKDQTGIKISIRLTTKDMATLMVEIMDHVLYVSSNTVSFDVKIPNRIKEENVRMCFSSNGTLNILMHRKNGSISCPQGTTRSESLKEYQK